MGNSNEITGWDSGSTTSNATVGYGYNTAGLASTLSSYTYHPTPQHYGLGNLIITKAEKKDMNNLSALAKRILNADTRALVKAGILDRELRLTSEGREILDALAVKANMKELVAAADEILEERKEDCCN
jgi:hypothetical protein